jgi:hypothetical protein
VPALRGPQLPDAEASAPSAIGANIANSARKANLNICVISTGQHALMPVPEQDRF